MKIYTVWTMNGPVDVKAEEVRRVDLIDKPIRVYFLVGNECVAEFYTEHVCGWAERKE